MTQRAQDFVTRFQAGWDARSPEQFVDLFVEDCTVEYPMAAAPLNRAGLRDWWTATFAAMPDLRLEVVRWLGDDEVVMIEWAVSGTAPGEGSHEISWAGVDRFVLDGDRARSEASYWDSHPLRTAVEGGATGEASGDGGAGMAAVIAYAEAKSAADVDGALRWCHPEWVLETVPYGIRAAGHDDTRLQLEAFFDTFPDYRVTSDGMISSGETVSSWGRVSATMSGPLLDIPATGRRYDVPYSCVFTIRDGLIARERFWFDLHDQCTQLGLSTAEVGAKLAEVRDLLAAGATA